LPATHFKKSLNALTESSAIVTIDKVGDEPLTIQYSKGKKPSRTTTYGEKLPMKCTIANDDIFSISVHAVNIRPFVSSLISDVVHISADKERRLMLQYNTDNMTIRIFTDIVSVGGGSVNNGV